jgi:hypothetical protein
MAFLPAFAEKSQTPVHPYFPNNVSAKGKQVSMERMRRTEKDIDDMEKEVQFLRDLVISLRQEIRSLRENKKPITVTIGG